MQLLCNVNQTLSEMEVKDILRNLREKNNLTQEQMAERINVTRQAISRWETGMTQPNPELLKVLSREFGVSINTLLGAPQTLYCQCCGMPLSDDAMISREPDGAFNEDYCSWSACLVVCRLRCIMRWMLTAISISTTSTATIRISIPTSATP